MTVGQNLFKLASRYLLEELAMDSAYWTTALRFVVENEHTELDQLTEKQKKWLSKIQDDLIEEAGKHTLG